MAQREASRKSKAAVSFALSMALILTSPGLAGYQAFGASLTSGALPVRGAVSGVSGVSVLGSGPSSTLTLSPLRNTSLSSPVLGLGAAPALSPSAAAALASSAQSAPAPQASLPSSALPVPASAIPAPAAAPDQAQDASAPATTILGRLAERFIPSSRKPAAELSRTLFDGEKARASATPDASQAVVSQGASRLARPDERAERIIADPSIPTPQAAREVGKLRRLQALPLWVKVVAPLSVIAAAAAAVSVGAVPVLTLAAGLVVSVLAHEVAHIAVLHKLGDHTAEEAGSHSLNPFSHIDPIKTIIVPALSLALSSALLPFPILIGAGKAVDADFNNLHSPFGGPRSARNAFWAAAAGPLTNLALAGLAFAAIGLLPAGGALAGVALGLAKMNLALTVFNLLPLPQLDGGKMLASLLPERLYAKWVYNPKVEKSYQGMFRRLYEGPTRLLTFMTEKLGIKSQKTLNRVANGVTFAALAAFYAVAFFHFSVAVPLLFLALPCTYDYWCVREKVRSEAAVNDLMELYSQWAAVIASLAEDKGMESEVSLFEAEHAMKNALETLVDEMMAKEDFRALSNEAKLEALMKAYPDKAAQYLKDKVFTEPGDTLEKIKALLADPRNEPFMNRLRKWFEDHNIFERWDNPKYEGKLKDAIKEVGKDNKKTKGQGGFARVGMMAMLATGGAAALLFPELAQQAPAWLPGLGLLGMMGTLGLTGGASPDGKPVASDEALADDSLVVEFASPMTESQIGDYMIDIGEDLPGIQSREVVNDDHGASLVVAVKLQLGAMEQVIRAAAMFRAMPVTARVRVSRATLSQMAGQALIPSAPLTEDEAFAKIHGDNPTYTKVEALFRPGTDLDAARAFIHGLGHDSISTSFDGTGRVIYELLMESSAVADMALRVAQSPLVLSVDINQDAMAALRARRQPAAVAAAEPEEPESEAPEAGRWQDKVLGREDERTSDVVIVLKADASKRAVARALNELRDRFDAVEEADGSRRLRALRPDYDLAAEVARSMAGRKWVDSVLVSNAIRDRIVAVSLPAKVASHGKEQYGINTILVKFAQETTSEEIARILKRLDESRIYRHGDSYTLNNGSLNSAAGSVKALVNEESVTAVEIHPNLAAFLEDRAIKPYPDAESYDHAQSLLVQFKGDATELMVKEYAELRRLRLVYAKFRGKEGLALLEVPRSADATATRRMLVDETLDEGNPVAEIMPFKEQPGEAAVSPSPAAQARVAARQNAAAAQAEAEKNPPRRDPAAEWLAYLQNKKMQDGTTLNDKQVKALATYLKPLAKSPNEPRPPVVARTEEVKRMLPIVTSPRGMRNSVILVGEAGTGKTAVAEGLAEMIEDAEHAGAKDSEAFLQFQRLKGRWLVELDINKILTAEDPVGTLSAILDLLPRFNEVNPARGNEIIVLMDEIQKFFLDNNGQKIANVLKGPLRDGKLSVIATTTRDEFKEHIEKDDAFRRRFEKIDVEEPTVEQTITILRAIKGYLQKLHDAFIPDESLVAAAKLADQFDKTNFNPDKAIKAVQDGAELARPDNLRAAITLDVRETWNQLVVAVNEARQALMDKGIASTLALPMDAYNRIAELIKRAEALYSEREAIADGKGRVIIDVVKRVIAQKTGIGSGQLNMGEEDAARYNEMEKTVGQRVINQEPALTAIANAIRRNKAGLSNPNRPMGKFLLTGPTGVGKTYLAKELARFLFKDPEAMIRMDMSEYMEEHTAQRLTGSPPGYVGYGEGGQLTEAVRKKPYSVILFDEVEKAHPKVFDVLLQILDDGRLTDGEGRTIDFKNTVIIMTSNAGMSTVDGEKYAKMLERVESHNLEAAAAQRAEIEAAWDKEIDDAVNESLKARFRPEFLNRLDEDPRSKNKWIRVNRLRRQDITKIASIQIKEFQDLLLDRHDTELVIDPSVISFLSEEGFSPLYGARPMTAAIEKHIVDPMARWILEEAAQGRKNVRGGLIKIKAEGGKIVFAAEAKPAKNIERAAFEGAARQTAAEVFNLIERLVGEGEGEEPSEGLFDKMLRSAMPKEAAGAKAELPAAARAFFAPETLLTMTASMQRVSALHNKPKGADAAVRSEIKSVIERMQAAGWSEAVRGGVSTPAGQVGEGWLKQVTAFAKGVAEKAGVQKPVELASAVSGDVVRLAVIFDAELTQSDKAYLSAHFTGTPPSSYEAAQRMVDDLNLNSAIIRNHYLLDLYRRLREIPGARMGYASTGGRAQLWLEIRKEDPKPVEAAQAPKAEAAEGAATPHQAKEMAKLRGLFLRFIDQSRLQPNEQDGISIRVAAAEAYARIAGPEEAELMRAWTRDRGWADKQAATEKLGADGPMAMTAALVLQRFGQEADMELLEAVLDKASGLHGDAFTPLKTSFILALAEVYKRAGLKAAREASIRASALDRDSELGKQAVHRALGALGYPSDISDLRADGEGLAQLYRRMGQSEALVAEFSDDTAWSGADASRKTAILKLLGESAEPTPKIWDCLRLILQGHRGAGDRSVRYAAAAAWAELTARQRLTKGLPAGIDLYLKERGVSQDDDTWAVMLAYVLALEKAGGAGDLDALETLMMISPEYNALHYRHEQAYFAAPEAWAKTLVRSGKFAEYARARLGDDGAPRPSVLQEMLMNKNKPLMVAAALRAMALARDNSFREKPVEPAGDAPGLHPGKKSPASGGFGGYPHGDRSDMYERRFGGHW